MLSIFRYPGGKTKRAASEWILSNKPMRVSEYREPFVGGGGVFFKMEKVEKRWINDINSGLVEVYRALAERPEDFISMCRETRPAVDGEDLTEPGPRGEARYPKRLVDEFDRVKLNTECDQAYRYFFINRTVFGGRVNYNIQSRLHFSNPGGWNIVDTDRLERAAKRLAGCKITCGSYQKLFREPGEDVWIYADPPYVVNSGLSKSSQLYQHNFTEEDHRNLAAVVKQCNPDTHKVAISYDDCDLVRELYLESDGFWIKPMEWAYCGTTSDTKEVGKELLITNYQPEPLLNGVSAMVSNAAGPLSEEERDQLAEQEAIAVGAYKSFVSFGEALRVIKINRLYREHGTFETYCSERLRIGRRYADCLIRSSELFSIVIENPAPGFPIFKATEKHVRPLTRLENDDDVSKAWSVAVLRAEHLKKPLTASMVKAEVDAILGIEKPQPLTKIQKAKNLLDTLSNEDKETILEYLNEQLVRN